MNINLKQNHITLWGQAYFICIFIYNNLMKKVKISDYEILNTIGVGMLVVM